MVGVDCVPDDNNFVLVGVHTGESVGIVRTEWRGAEDATSDIFGLDWVGSGTVVGAEWAGGETAVLVELDASGLDWVGSGTVVGVEWAGGETAVLAELVWFSGVDTDASGLDWVGSGTVVGVEWAGGETAVLVELVWFSGVDTRPERRSFRVVGGTPCSTAARLIDIFPS